MGVIVIVFVTVNVLYLFEWCSYCTAAAGSAVIKRCTATASAILYIANTLEHLTMLAALVLVRNARAECYNGIKWSVTLAYTIHCALPLNLGYDIRCSVYCTVMSALQQLLLQTQLRVICNACLDKSC
jgi:hypothetical protein